MNLDNAIKLATDAHAGQVDKGGQPYILHPLRVMLAMAITDERSWLSCTTLSRTLTSAAMIYIGCMASSRIS